MFCPGCGLEERHSTQFCRACGTDLRAVRTTLERPDTVTASAATARDEIGRAVAARIRETTSAKELKKVTEEVLPKIEKFLESPAEKRMRRMRTGTLISSIGAGAAIGLSIAGIIQKEEDFIFLAALGVITFFLGLSFIFNALFLTIPKKSLADKSGDGDRQRELDAHTGELTSPEPASLFTSVTENTTKHLKEKVKIGNRD